MKPPVPTGHARVTIGDAPVPDNDAPVIEDLVTRRRRLAGLPALFTALRPRQWIKNGFVAAPLIFSGLLTSFTDVLRVVATVICFCLIASSLYVFNDIKDRHRDLHHPEKRHRPIASGALSIRVAVAAASVCGSIGLFVGSLLDARLFGILAAYAALMAAYTLALKHVPILDVFVIAAGFVLRVLAGAVAIDVYASPWLLLCMGLLALLLGFGKRRHEALSLENAAVEHRPSLRAYTPRLADCLVGLTALATGAAYVAYTLVARPPEDGLFLTIPFVLVGVSRYLWLVLHERDGGNPTELAWTDRPLIATVGLWFLVAGLLVTF